MRRIAQELGVDLAAVTATGAGGRVTEDDVRAAAAGPAEGRRVAIRGIRRRIVEHLTTAHREIPAVTFVEECDFTGIDLGAVVPLTLRATAHALKEFPELNARLEGDEIVYLDRYDLGLAVQTDDGLVVPVVRGCDTASLDELAAEAERLAAAARAGTLTPEELRGSTFTVTSAGKLGGLVVTPLINHPEVANPRHPPDRGPRRRPRRRDRRAPDGERLGHVRPPRRRRRARRRVLPRRDRPARDGRDDRLAVAPVRWPSRRPTRCSAGRGSRRPGTWSSGRSRTPCRRELPPRSRRSRRRSIPWPLGPSTLAGVAVPLSDPDGVGQARTPAGGDGRFEQNQIEMPPLTPVCPKWMWACVTEPVRFS